MIGLIKLTGSGGEDLFINPNHISWFTTNTPQMYMQVTQKVPEGILRGSIVMTSGVPFQVIESVDEITRAITRLRNKMEQNALALRKQAERSEWDDDFLEGEE